MNQRTQLAKGMRMLARETDAYEQHKEDLKMWTGRVKGTETKASQDLKKNSERLWRKRQTLGFLADKLLRLAMVLHLLEVLVTISVPRESSAQTRAVKYSWQTVKFQAQMGWRR